MKALRHRWLACALGVSACFAHPGRPVAALAQAETPDAEIRHEERAKTPGVQNKPELVIRALPVYIKGFPCILRLLVKGPFFVPATTVFSTLADVHIKLISKAGGKADGKTYSMLSATSRGGGGVVAGPGGVRVDGSWLQEADPFLPEGAQRSLLLDLSSLRNLDPDGVSLAQVPPGKYELQVTLFQWRPDAQVQAQPVEVELGIASAEESRYLTQVKALGQKSEDSDLRRGLAVRPDINWAEVLAYAVPVDEVDAKSIGQSAKAQLSYHLLLSKILTFTGALKDFDQALLQSVETPPYLQPEQKSLMLEVEILAGREEQVRPQTEALLKQEPAVAWRLQEAQQGNPDYLSFRKKKEP